MNDTEAIILKLFVFFALLFLNGFFTATGFAIVKIRATQIEPLARRGHFRARVASNLVRHLDSYLAATQLGNVMTSLGMGWMGEGFITPLLKGMLAGFSMPDLLTRSLGFIIPFGTVTFLNIMLGELAPKSIAIQRTKATVLWTAVPMQFFFFFLRPAVWLLNGAAGGLLRLLGIQRASESELGHSEEELRLLLAGSHEKEISPLARRLALRAFDLRKRIVREIMLPRRQIEFLDLKRPIAENLQLAQHSKHTRFPLCDGGLDRVVGLIHIKDLLWASEQAGGAVDLSKIRREILTIPETMGLERVLTTFQRSRQHMAVVADEYGSVVGMVTIEDVIEELVGEIQDEFDQEASLIQDLGNGEFLAEGITPLRQLNAAAGTNFHSEDVDTLSGYIVQQLGRLPAEGESFELDGFAWTVKKMGRRRIHQLHGRRKPPAT
jgi:CBS domain containing-hemolysin-like protein